MMSRHLAVAIAGNIGAGKSTLAAKLAASRGWIAVLEPADANPYLSDFYQDMERWAFHSQVFFLTRRLIQYRLTATADASGLVYDRTIYEDAEVFARHLYEIDKLSEVDWRTYRELYESVRDLLPLPDVVVYLRAPVETLLARVKLRGIDYERSLSRAYLSSLDELYEHWIANFSLAPVIQIDTDTVDFLRRHDEVEAIALQIESKLGSVPR